MVARSSIVALALLESAAAFQAPAALKASSRSVAATMFSEGDIGVTPPLGVWDPLGLIAKRDMRRYEIMEIKHGRAAMLGFIHTILIHAGVRFPGYLSPSQGLKFADMPVGNFAALEATPTAGWLAIMLVTCMTETGASACHATRRTHPLPWTISSAPSPLSFLASSLAGAPTPRLRSLAPFPPFRRLLTRASPPIPCSPFCSRERPRRRVPHPQGCLLGRAADG